MTQRAHEDDINYYIILELCKGGMLKEYVNKHDLYGENTVASIVRGILRGLHHIHEQGIIHRDIKGPNVMLADNTEDAEIRIMDFGAAMFTESHLPIPTTDVVGTPWFMAPEVLGWTAGPKSDIWSVGVLTYQLLFGRMPFNDKTNPMRPSIIKLFKSIYMDNPIDRMDKIETHMVSDAALEFVRWCLEKSYHDRPTATEALQHRWLTSTDCTDRFKGSPLTCTPFIYEEGSLMNAATMCNGNNYSRC